MIYACSSIHVVLFKDTQNVIIIKNLFFSFKVENEFLVKIDTNLL